ncbi:MAG: hypothetical protein KatS3mg076_1214 [Candidatus Binatia bacterium]|nr:MAG: hypothetical protein KatS3mg076_1214 [Candidatus Binatia bacterium]
MRSCAFALSVALALFCAPGATRAGEEIGENFRRFCESWMERLHEQEKANRRALEWRATPDGFEAEYVGYGPLLRCEARGEGSTAVGKLAYEEYRYRQKGPTREAAEAARPEIVDATEVTEVFRYDGSKWAY